MTIFQKKIKYLISFSKKIKTKDFNASEYLKAITYIKKKSKQYEPYVICKNCSGRIRADTANNMVYCDCGMTGVKGDASSFQLDAKEGKHMIIFADPKRYIISENQLW